MRHTFLVGVALALLLLFVSPVWAIVNCTPDEITLSTQEDVDNFQTNHGPGCDTIVKKLTVSGAGITDLNPLSGLTAGAASPTWSTISITGTSVTSLAGLDNLSSTYWFELINNASLTDLSPLASLTDVQGPLFIEDNSSLTNLTGLSGVTSLPFGSLFLRDNPMLSDLGALSGLTFVGGSVSIWNNDALQNLNGLNGLNTVNGSLQVIQNDGLVNIDALAGVTNYSGTFELRFNSKLVTIPDFTGWTELNGLIVYFNSALTDLDGLAGLQTVGNQYNVLWVKSNASLTNLDGLADLIGIELGLEVADNPLLADCSGLAKVLDQTDDGQPGPGPGSAGIPDIGTEVTIGNNLPGCNSIADITGVEPAPDFELVPQVGGLNTIIGARSLVNPDKSCDWSPGETVEIWWGKLVNLPDAKLATFTVDAMGCFQGMIALELDPGDSTPGSHPVQARGNVSGISNQTFEQVEPELLISPHQGAPGREVNASGCNWVDATTVNVIWMEDDTVLGALSVDGGGCINETIKLPKLKDGIYGLSAESDNGLFSGAAFRVFEPTVTLTPPEGPPGSKVPLAGVNWFAEEVIEFAFTGDNVVFDSAGTGTDGRITTNSPVEPTLRIPASATLGEKTIKATGQTSGLTYNVPFTVREPTLEFTPTNGQIGDAVTVSGCGWVSNETVEVVWGHPDHNKLPIKWAALVDPATGCFGQNQELVINVPPDTITGPIENTATGDVGGTALGTFTVNYPGRVEATNPNGYAGHAITLRFHDVIPNEILDIQAGGNPSTRISVQATQSDFLFDYTLPTSYRALVTASLSVTGSKGFGDSVQVNILDNAEISVPDPSDVRLGRPLKVEGRNWSSHETVSFKLVQGAQETSLFQNTEVAAGEIDFLTYLTLPDSLVPGDYILRAEGSKDRDAELSVFVGHGAPAAFTLAAGIADPPPDLDGYLAIGEWDYEQKVDLGNGFISARSDDTRLYILIDLLADTVKDSLGADNFWLSFDTTGNGAIDAGLDLNFRLQGSDLILEEYTGPDSFAPRNSVNLRSAYAAGFNCFTPDNSARVEFNGLTATFICDEHRVFEIGIDLQSINAQPGDIVRVGVLAQSQVPTFSEKVPAGFPSDFSELGTILLAPSQLNPGAPTGLLTGIGSNGFEVEVTQAVQDQDNSIKLVADKGTAVRVYPTASSFSMARTYLFGRKGGQDLPGSPLVTVSRIPQTILRGGLNNTANFLLPASWAAGGILDLTAITENLDGSNPKAVTDQVNFITRRIPELWVFPFNVGDSANPILPTNANMNEQEDVLELLLPTPATNFVRRPWSDNNHPLNTATCPAISTVGNNDGVLDPGETLLCTSTHTVTQKDIDRGRYDMTAFAATGSINMPLGPIGMRVRQTPPASSSIQAVPVKKPQTQVSGTLANLANLAGEGGGGGGTPRLSFSIASDISTFDDVGDDINYTYTLQSTGTAPVAGPITVGDSKNSISLTDMKKELNDYWNLLNQAKTMSGDTTPMPDQLYGFKVFSDQSTLGTSNAVHSGGRGHVTVGQANGSDTNTMTMLHEYNHNLEGSATGTWARHVGDPNDKNNTDWGCGATGVDLAWPFTGDSETHATGFNTTLPWRLGPGDNTVIPSNIDDYMSYCRDNDRPVQWVSPYRWEAQFARFTLPPPTLSRINALAADVFYVSGRLNSDGTGSIDPVQLMPGKAETAQAAGDYAIVLEDSGDGVLFSMSFTTDFTDGEGEPVDGADFSWRLPFHAGVAEVLLQHNGITLDSIEVSANPPTLQVTAPSGGEKWIGDATVQWTSNDLDGDLLEFSVLYSPDGGVNWFPVASRLTGNEYTVDAGSLPGGTGGRIMVIASDGFHTVLAESSGAFTVPDPAPIVVIDSPPDNFVVEPSDWIQLRGSASLPSGPADDLTFVWFVDGEMTEIGNEARILLEEGIHEITLTVYDDEVLTGEVSVSVTVDQNNPPNEPILPFPADNATKLFVKSMLNWVGGDIDGDPVHYDVYLEAGNSDPGVLVCDKVMLSACAPPGGLLQSTQYFWRVVAHDDQGGSSEGDTWMFATGDQDPSEVIFLNGLE